MTRRIAVLLCAGYGTRMGSLTAETPKPLLPVAGKPILDYLLEQLLGLEELDAVHLVTNRRYLARFCSWAGPWRRRLDRRELEIHDDGSTTNADRRGAVGDLALVLERAGLPDAALVAAGDNVLRFSLRPFWRAFLDTGENRVLALHEPSAERLRRTGVLELGADDRVLRLHEKPEEPPSNWACPPFYCLARSALDRVRGYLAAGPPDEIGRFIADLARHETVRALRIAGERLDVGSPESYRRADAILRRREVVIPCPHPVAPQARSGEIK